MVPWYSGVMSMKPSDDSTILRYWDTDSESQHPGEPIKGRDMISLRNTSHSTPFDFVLATIA